jgi:CTP:molybdopterin cytidylyltransferase MocA
VIAGIILAAGASERMGTPKALLDYRGETFLDRLVRMIGEVCDPVMVVLGYHADTIRAGVKRDAVWVRNANPERGMLSSLQTGLRAVPEACSRVLFTPVDFPAVSESTLVRLISTVGPLVQPVYQGQRGHPVLIDKSIAAEILALPENAQARDAIHRHTDQATYIEVEDAGVIADIDLPADYQRLSGSQI